jgi:hypothetical protein
LESVLIDGEYKDQVRDMIPPECAILACSSMPGAMCYSGIGVVENNAVIVHAARRVPTSWPDRDNGLWKQRVGSRFAPAPADSGSWQTYSSVLTPPVTPGSAQTASPPPGARPGQEIAAAYVDQIERALCGFLSVSG